VKIIPHSADTYGFVGSFLVPLAIPMLLFQADLKRVLAEIGPMLKAFVASALVIAVAIVSLTLMFDFGEHESKVAGILTASYIGGSLNFVATAQAVQLDDPSHHVTIRKQAKTSGPMLSTTKRLRLSLSISPALLLHWPPVLSFAQPQT